MGAKAYIYTHLQRDSGFSQPVSGWVPAFHLPEVCFAEFDGDSLPTGWDYCHRGAEGTVRPLPGSSLKGLSRQVVALDLELELGGHHQQIGLAQRLYAWVCE